MCGIFGVVGFEFEKLNLARESINSLKHRGPDQFGEYFDKNVYIGHRRLSILDLSERGKQPMVSKTKDLIISVNGEIYNYVELRNLLKDKYEFISTSDSEVILFGYMEWGIEGLLRRIEGMYAISIYDKKKNRVFLIRDRVGIKPLYYAIFKDCIVWASELKAIKNYLKNCNLEIDYTAIYDFLTYSYIPSPKTKYKNIYKLLPACYLSINITDFTYYLKKYWDLIPCEKNISLSEATEELKHLIKKSVKEQMISDVPIGFFLSGGLDSSTVVGFASELSEDIQTFSIGFDESLHNELKYAEIIAKKFNVNNYTKILSFNRAKELFTSLNTWFDEPFGDLSALPTFLVSEFAKKSVTVVLSGDGGDEIFGGYKWYYRVNKSKFYISNSSEKIKNILSVLRNKNRFSIISKLANRIQNDFFVSNIERILRFQEAMLKFEKTNWRYTFNIEADYDDYWVFNQYSHIDITERKKLQFIDFHTYLPDDILTKVDRVSMSVALEVRVPLLSTEIIEFMFSLPESIVYFQGRLKGLLKEAVKDLLPIEIIQRSKKGFSIPYKTWTRKNIFDGMQYQIYLLKNIYGFNEIK
jgi:asparagine synthase (glutamine-hydrolysing)